jgi:SAM-dependent methyltransferase
MWKFMKSSMLPGMEEGNNELYHDLSWLYDATFDWDIEDEVDWLIERLGENARSILEPFCGSGRLFPAFARRGVEVFGVDLSEEMLVRAEARMVTAGLPAPKTFRSDARDFDLGVKFDGAICPINSFGYLLTEEDAHRHLACVARHLRSGGCYLPQVDLRWLAGFTGTNEPDVGEWEVEHEKGRIGVKWFGRSFDPKKRIELQVSRFTFLSGPEKGRVIEDEHRQRLWDWSSWNALIEASPFEQVAAYDGRTDGWPELPLSETLEDHLLLWHELVKR